MRGRLKPNSKGLGTGCVVLFLLPFATVGVIMGFRMVWHVWFWMEAQSWVECPAFIDHVELQVHSDEGTTYNTSALYRYQYQGVQHSGTRVWFSSNSDSGSFHQNAYRQLLDHQQSAKPFRCFVDPDEPNQSVLYRELRPSLLWFYSVFLTAFGGVGIGGLYVVFRHAGHARNVRAEAERFPDEPWKWEAATASGQFFPAKQWLSYLVGAVLFNLIAVPGSLFLFLERGRPNWALGILLLFAAVGLWLAWQAIQRILQKRRYGEFHLQIEPWPYFIGEPLQGTLQFPGMYPGSRELIFELRVLEQKSGDDPDTELFKETVAVSNTGRDTLFAFNLPATLPRTRRETDEIGEKTAAWKLMVTGSDGPGDFEAHFALATYKRSS